MLWVRVPSLRPSKESHERAALFSCLAVPNAAFVWNRPVISLKTHTKKPPEGGFFIFQLSAFFRGKSQSRADEHGGNSCAQNRCSGLGVEFRLLAFPFADNNYLFRTLSRVRVSFQTEPLSPCIPPCNLDSIISKNEAVRQSQLQPFRFHRQK